MSAKRLPLTVSSTATRAQNGRVHGLVLDSFTAFLREAHKGVAGLVPHDASFLPSQAYADEDFTHLLEHAAGVLGTSPRQLERGFGQFAGRSAFARLYPDFYDASGDTRTFLLHVEQRIHDLVRATIPDAAPPRLHVTPFGHRDVVVTYTSERLLCHMVEGLVAGVADYYGESARIDHSQCMLRGDLACALFVVLDEAG